MAGPPRWFAIRELLEGQPSLTFTLLGLYVWLALKTDSHFFFGVRANALMRSSTALHIRSGTLTTRCGFIS